MGNYVGNNPNGIDLFMSDDYTSNSSKLVASTKCVQKAVESIVGKQATAKMKQVARTMSLEPEPFWKSVDGRSWSFKTTDGLILNCGYTPEEGEVKFHFPFSTEHYILLGVGDFSRTPISFVPECVNVQYIAFGY